MSITEMLSNSRTVLPSDIDINGHVNNGRYLTLLDLSIIEFFLRTGILRTALSRRWRPILAGSIITYRKGLRPFQRYTINLTFAGADARWTYFRFEFLANGRIAAAGYSKGGMAGRGGWIPVDEAAKAFGIQLEGNILPKAVLAWREAEAALIEERNPS